MSAAWARLCDSAGKGGLVRSKEEETKSKTKQKKTTSDDKALLANSQSNFLLITGGKKKGNFVSISLREQLNMRHNHAMFTFTAVLIQASHCTDLACIS